MVINQDRDDIDETQLATDEVEVCVELLRQTDLAILVNDGDRDVWIPKSVIKDPPITYLEDIIQRAALRAPPSENITIPEWFAIKEEFI